MSAKAVFVAVWATRVTPYRPSFRLPRRHSIDKESVID